MLAMGQRCGLRGGERGGIVCGNTHLIPRSRKGKQSAVCYTRPGATTAHGANSPYSDLAMNMSAVVVVVVVVAVVLVRRRAVEAASPNQMV